MRASGPEQLVDPGLENEEIHPTDTTNIADEVFTTIAELTKETTET